LALAEKANELMPNQPALMDTLAYLLAQENQGARAVSVQKGAIAAAPENQGLRLTLAKIYLQTGDKAKARAELEALAQLGEKFGAQAEVTKLMGSL
jgi:predicted Zn-dependent protease